MRVVLAFGWIPVLVLKRKPPGEFRGFTRVFTWLLIPSCWILIKPDYWQDEHILAHELQHVEDYLKSPWLYWFRYQSAEGRLNYEIRAYARQYVSYGTESPARFNRYVGLIVDRYGLSVFSTGYVSRRLRAAIILDD